MLVDYFGGKDTTFSCKMMRCIRFFTIFAAEQGNKRCCKTPKTMAKGKNKQGARRLNKQQLSELVMDFFQHHAGEVIDIKTIFRELHLNTHPAKLLCMDVLDDLLMDDYIIEQAQMRYTLASKSTNFLNRLSGSSPRVFWKYAYERTHER